MINFRDVTKKYGTGDAVLEGINFLVDKGSFAYLVGPTGSGKTTIFRLIIRDLLPTEGAIMIGEWDLSSLPHSKIPRLRRHVGVVFQDLKLLLDRTVVENVMLPLEFAGVGEVEAKRRAEEILIEVGLQDKKDKFPAQLSGGESQRVAIARALVFDPQVILADEPTGNLDTKTSFQILDLLKNINRRGTTIFMATHDDKLIGAQDRVIILDKGKIVEDKKAPVKHNNSDKEHEDREEKPSKESPAEEKKDNDDDRKKIKLATLAASKVKKR